MAKSDALFFLIKSLNQAERRYVKLFARNSSSETDKKYLRLYDVMLKHSDAEFYEEEVIVELLKGSIEPRNLSYEKNYLYNFILKCLRNFHSQNTPKFQIQELIININLLYERDLLKEAFRLIRKAKKLSKKYDYDLQYLEVTLLERKIIRQFTDRNNKQQLEESQLDCQNSIDNINSQLEMLDLYENIFLEVKNYGSSKPLNKVLKEKVLKLPSTLGISKMSFKLKMYYHLTFSMYYYITNDQKQRGIHLKAVLDYFEQHDYLLNDVHYQGSYLRFLNNYINHCFVYGSSVELNDQIKVLENYKTSIRAINIQIEQYTYYSKMLLCFKTKDFAALVAISPDIDTLLKKYEDSITLKRKLTFLLNMASAYLLELDFESSRLKINEIIDQPKFEVRKDIQILARIIRIILFYEEDEYSLAEYEIIAATRYLKKFRGNNPIERKIIAFLKKLLFTSNQKLIIEELNAYLNDQNGYEELKTWCVRKLISGKL